MTGDILKSFLVSLGFDVDDASLKKFNQSIAEATIKVTTLAAAITATATAVGAGISSVSQDFEQMGYEYHIIAPMISRVLLLRRELLKAYSAAGINISKVVQQSVRLNLSINKTKFALEAIYKSVASKFFPLLTKQSDIFRKNLYAHLPQIQAALEKFVSFLIKAFGAVTQLGARAWSILTRIYDFFVELHKATQGWSTILLGVIAAWDALNLSFLATPLGAILAGLVAILALYDDFKTFQEGGKSFFNWTEALPTIEAVKKALSAVGDTLKDLFNIAGELVDALAALFDLNFTGFITHLDTAIGSLVSGVKDLWSALDKILSVGDVLAPWLSKIFGSSTNIAANIQANPAVNPAQVAPIGSQTQAAQTNQHVNQQTNITVQGSADANSIGKSVAGEQSRVNADMTRNLKGATR